MLSSNHIFYILLLFLTLFGENSYGFDAASNPSIAQRHFEIDDPATENITNDIELDLVHINPKSSQEDLAPTIDQFFPEAETAPSDVVYVNLATPSQPLSLSAEDVRLEQTINISKENIHLTYIRAGFVGGMVLLAVVQSTGDLGKATYSMFVPALVTAYLAIANPGYREWLIGEHTSPFLGRLPLPGLRNIPLPFIKDPTQISTGKTASLPMQAAKMTGFLAAYLSLLSFSDKFIDYTFDGVDYLNSLGAFYSFADLKKIFASVVEALPAEMIFLSLNAQLSKRSIEATPTVENLRHVEKWSARATTLVSAFLTAGQVAAVVSPNIIATIGSYQLNEGALALHGASLLGAGVYFLKLTSAGQKITSVFKGGCQSVFGGPARPNILP